MDVRQSFFTALRNMLANKTRFLQATLAMVIGVAGVVVVLTLGFTMFSFNDFAFDQYAPGLFRCDVRQNAAYAKAVGPAEMERLARDNPEVIAAVSPLIGEWDLPLSLRKEDRVYNEAVLYGVDESYMATYNGVYIQDGRFLQNMDIEREQKVCVLGNDIAEALFEGDAVGKELKIWGENYRVVGVLSDALLENYQLYIPYTVARKIYGEDIRSYDSNEFYDDSYFVVANGLENIGEARLLIEDLLRQKTGGETGSVYDYRTKWSLSAYSASLVGEVARGGIVYYFNFALLALGLVLLISCAGIVNVMLASVQERTKEIGIRRAYGATDQDIKRQFTLESVATSLIGGGLGLALGLGAVVIMAAAGVILPINGGYQINFGDMNWLTLSLPILAALAACIGVGVLAAAYPAQQAVKTEIVASINAD